MRSRVDRGSVSASAARSDRRHAATGVAQARCAVDSIDGGGRASTAATGSRSRTPRMPQCLQVPPSPAAYTFWSWGRVGPLVPSARCLCMAHVAPPTHTVIAHRPLHDIGRHHQAGRGTRRRDTAAHPVGPRRDTRSDALGDKMELYKRDVSDPKAACRAAHPSLCSSLKVPRTPRTSTT